MKSQRETTEEGMAMTQRMFGLFLVVLFLALAPAAMASNTWYVDGVNGNDNNNCKSPQTACKTIGHAISLASSGDSITVAAATYTENLTIGISLEIFGANAGTTIVDGDRAGTVFTILGGKVALSRLSIRNGWGGIENHGTLTINSSTISHNALHGIWGGISNRGTLVVNNSTIAFNPSGCNQYRICGAGGILNAWLKVIVSNSTISDNNKGINSYYGTVTFQNSILANNGSRNCGGTITSNGYNLSSDGTCNFNGTGDLNNTDPKLGKLGYHGGPTQTMPLLSGSPAIDAGNPNGCTDGNGNLLKTDQRGYPRPDKEDNGIGCDMGAYERQSD